MSCRRVFTSIFTSRFFNVLIKAFTKAAFIVSAFNVEFSILSISGSVIDLRPPIASQISPLKPSCRLFCIELRDISSPPICPDVNLTSTAHLTISSATFKTVESAGILWTWAKSSSKFKVSASTSTNVSNPKFIVSPIRPPANCPKALLFTLGEFASNLWASVNTSNLGGATTAEAT